MTVPDSATATTLKWTAPSGSISGSRASVGQPEDVPGDPVQHPVGHDDESSEFRTEQLGCRLQELHPERLGVGGQVGVSGDQRQEARDRSGERIGGGEYAGLHRRAVQPRRQDEHRRRRAVRAARRCSESSP